MKNARLIFVHSLFYPDYSAGSQMLSDLCFFLVKKDFDISVVTSKKMYENNHKLLPVYEEVKNVKIYRIWSSNLGRQSYLRRILDYLTLELSIIFKLLKLVKKGDIVVLMTDPPLLNVLALPFIKFKGGKVVNWLQDIFPEVAVEANVIKKGSVVNKIITKLRNISLNKAEVNIVVGRLMLKYLTDIGVETKKIARIPNWSDGSTIKPLLNKDNNIRKKFGLNDKFVIGYSGNLGIAHDIKTFYGTIELLQKYRNIFFLFIGGGYGMKELKKHVKEKKLMNVMFQPYQSRDLLPLTLNVADVHWVTLEPNMEGYIVPSKYYGILASGKPVIFIGDKDGELSVEINEARCGASVAIGDVQLLSEIIRLYSEDIDLVNQVGQRGRKMFETLYDMPISTNKFLQLFTELTTTNNN